MFNSQHLDIQKFLTFFRSMKEQNFVSYDGRTLLLKFTKKLDVAEFNLIEKVFKTTVLLPNNQVEIVLSSVLLKNHYLYFNEIDFINRYSIKEKYNESVIIILKLEGKSIIKQINQSYLENNKFIYNLHEYKQILNDFLTTPELVPYKSETDKVFTIISKENGVFNVGYSTPKEDYFHNVNLSGLRTKLNKEFKKKEYIQFFKEIIISGVHNTPEKLRYSEILKTSATLLSLARRDYETYVSNFAFDKLKSEFKTERESYFASLDKNIASVGKQVVSFPLTFAATIFASYKVKEQPGILLLILVAYLLYSIVAFLILRMTSYNVKCLKQDVQNEETSIKDSYKLIFEDFKEDFKKIKNKIKKLRTIIVVLYIVLIFLFLLFTAFAMHTMGWFNLEMLVEWVPKSKVLGKTN